MKTFYKQDFMCWEERKEQLLLYRVISLWVTLLAHPDEEFVHITVNSPQEYIETTENEVIRPAEMFSPSGKITPQGPRQLPKKISKYVFQAWEATGRWILCQLESVMIGKWLWNSQIAV